MAEDEGKGRLDKLQMFEGREIRSVWVEEEEDWYFSVVDVVGVCRKAPIRGTIGKFSSTV
ncbi:hypothetical protein [Gordonibacter massiliensis (ex Traore et al. 2017)]|uniref:Bro-N domain-containing protein n=1 Tax=Gordonibacter massiliensis (ex Traore et al. 2017) TaxID=1841863 RepID=A0A842JN98_9ACTN|nr:hypothetical protein [Gordonibacter massiliensis (ex Traore et al. 2017)]MBC2890730.1 hypothetical protein [Gordonibacter massiliensis (ex Traore et al. 2017)]